jgi:sulfate permease
VAIKAILLITTVIFFAMNMGGSNIAPSFATLFGARLIDHKKAVLWFTLFIFLGAVLFGQNVAKTLGKGIIPEGFITFDTALIILVAALSGLFIANILRVPESTSWTTVFAISGVGFALNHVKLETLLKIIPFWIILPAVGFGLTYFLYKIIYPPRFSNLWLYQAIFNHEKKVRALAFISCCYIAFACGTNNVANAVGPLAGANIIVPLLGLAVIAPLFGLGGFFFGKRIMTTVGEEIVPLGLVSASLVGFVTASLLIFASIMGVPQSLVQLSALSVMAIGAVKHERHIFREKAAQRIFFTWAVTPILSFSLGYSLVKIFLGGS